MQVNLLPRYLESKLKIALSDTPVVCILGARQCGKTTLAQQFDNQRTYINFDDAAILTAAKQDPTGFIEGLPEKVILDEIQRIPAWHTNQVKRLVKTPEIHWVDSGLASTLNSVKVSEWFDHKVNFGALLESFVVQQIIAQAGWLEEAPRFSHYRDKDQVEVDLVIELGRKVWGVEVKKAASIQAKDGIGLSRLAAQCGDSFQGGILFYCGNNCLPLAEKNSFAVPISWLWELPKGI